MRGEPSDERGEGAREAGGGEEEAFIAREYDGDATSGSAARRRRPTLQTVRNTNYIRLVPGSLPLDLTLACSRFARLAARRADVGVSSVTWRVAAAIDQHGELSISAIAALENVTRPTTTTVVQRLEELGLVRRRTDPSDSRSSLVSLTELGSERLTAWRTQVGDEVEGLLAGLDAAERATLADAVDLLDRLLAEADSAPRRIPAAAPTAAGSDEGVPARPRADDR